MQIPLMDMKKQYEFLKPELLSKVEEVLSSCSYIHGKYVTVFENAFSALQGAHYCSGCSNGTSALFLALAACGIGPGDEVITVSHTFIATAEAISHTGATPVFVDVNSETYTLDPELLENAITERTKAIVPVHIYGCPAEMGKIMALSAKYGLVVVEDCAQAHLATYRGKPVGSLGAAGTFSFYPGKNLGACGDAGAVVSFDPQLIGDVRKLLNHGRAEKYIHDVIGHNHRMDELQAGILTVKLKYLQQWTQDRRKHAGLYSALLADCRGVKLPQVQEGGEHVFHLYVIQIDDRDRIADALLANGISTGIHYPLPLHLQPAYRHLGYHKGDFPVTENLAEHALSLPLFPELSSEQIAFVCKVLRDSL